MKVGVDVRELQRGVRTGIGRMVEAVIADAPRKRDVELFLYSDSTTRTGLSSTAANRRTLPQPTTLWFDQVALPRALARDRVDVLWSPYYKAPLFPPCPYVVTIHDLISLATGRPRLKNALFKPWAKIIGSRAARIITDSEHSRGDIVGTLGLDRSRIEAVPLGVSSEFSPERRGSAPELLRRLGIPGRYILTVTNFRRHKNDSLLVRAFARLASQQPSVSLVLAGKAAEDPQNLLRLIEELDLRGRVHLPGFISDEDLPTLYADAELFVFPSAYEGFGLPVLEAMASGVAVVCSSSSSLPEIAQGAAILLPPEDEDGWSRTISDLLTDEAQRNKWVHAGIERARVFTWQRTVDTIFAILERATA